jgi:hypothetical protein
MVSYDLASKPVATVSSGLVSKPVVTIFSNLSSKLVATVSLRLTSKPRSISWLSLKIKVVEGFLVLASKLTTSVW